MSGTTVAAFKDELEGFETGKNAQYFGLSPEQRVALEKLRKTIRATAILSPVRPLRSLPR